MLLPEANVVTLSLQSMRYATCRLSGSGAFPDVHGV